jgi:GNAT superfamily N-acetyltransferase
MTNHHPLDRPVWNALKAGWADLAINMGQGLRLDPEYGPFGAVADVSSQSLAAMVNMVPSEGELWIVEAQPMPLPTNGAVIRTVEVDQMVAEMLNPIVGDFDIIALTGADASEMYELAHLTQPGPFVARTHQLGDFFGVRHDGRLIAMAGERMKPDGFTEVSGVCTHPDHRGHGLAGALMSVVADAIIKRGEIPFLHCFSSNRSAIAIYEKLGFKLRCQIMVAMLSRQ